MACMLPAPRVALLLAALAAPPVPAAGGARGHAGAGPSAGGARGAAAARREGSPRFAEGELLVRWRDGRAASRAHASARARLVRRVAPLGLDRVRLPRGASVEEEARRYAREPGVLYAEPNWILRKTAATDDARYGEQWGLAAIGWPAAWEAWGSGPGAEVLVAVVDTGIRLDHEDLAASLWTNAADPPGDADGDGSPDDDGDGIADDVHGARFLDGVASGDPTDDDLADSHGTHVAGTIGAVANNGLGVAGVSWSVRLMAVKVLHGSRGEGTVADVVEGIAYAVDRGARILNCSFAERFPDGSESAALAEAFAYADASGALVVTAAGNWGLEVGTRGLPDPMGTIVMPASIRTPNQLGVAATAPDGGLAFYSDRGSRAVDVAAPGGLPSPEAAGVLSTTSICPDEDLDDRCDSGVPEMGYGYLAGTSMAAPHVTGVAALVWSAYPSLGHREVKARILNGAAPVAALAGLTITGGGVDAAASLSPALDGMPAVFRVTPYRALPGEQVTVDGVGFGPAAGTVTVGGVPLAVDAWTDGSIVATVPDGAPSGPVQVNGEGSTFPLAVPGAPSVVLQASPPEGTAPLEVTFTATAAEPGDVVRWEWDFGTGELREHAGITSSAVVTFRGAGRYLARARVTDAIGRSGTAELLVVAADADDSHCFVATAAFGSPLHPHVRTLRAFRDRWLLASAPGRALVRAYYAASPPLAEVIRRRPALRAAARWALAPLVLAVAHPGGFAASAAAALAFGAAAAAAGRRRRRGAAATPAGPRRIPRAPG